VNLTNVFSVKMPVLDPPPDEDPPSFSLAEASLAIILFVLLF
jgi:hypothetical protein